MQTKKCVALFLLSKNMVTTRRGKRNGESSKKNTQKNKKPKLNADQEAESTQSKGKGKLIENSQEEDLNHPDQEDPLDNESDEESFDWEAVEIPQDPDVPMEDKPQVYGDVEIVMETPRPVLK